MVCFFAAKYVCLCTQFFILPSILQITRSVLYCPTVSSVNLICCSLYVCLLGYRIMFLFSSAHKAGCAAFNNYVSETRQYIFVCVCLSCSNNTMVWDLQGKLLPVHACLRARVPQPLPGLYPSKHKETTLLCPLLLSFFLIIVLSLSPVFFILL